MDSAEAALERLCDPAAEVSAHYLIAADGRAWQMVDEAARAWHAGQGAWAGQGDVNSRSIGIELDNRGTHPFAEPQMAVLEQLLAAILRRWGIVPSGVIGHSDMAPERKQDPGRRFDWARLARAGLAVAAAPADISGRLPLASSLAILGYPPAAPDALLEAFRARHRPWAHGAESAADRQLAAVLAARFPADRLDGAADMA